MDILDSWSRSLRAANRSALTIDAYMADVGHLRTHLDGIDELDATRRDIDGFLANRTRADGRQGQLADATIARRYRTLVQFYGWLEIEGEIQTNPMLKRKPPKVAEQPPPIIPEDQLTALLNSCRGKQIGKSTRHRAQTKGGKAGRFSEFECRRDEALILMLSTTGIRSAELMGLHLDDIDLGPETFTVRGKGNRLRIVAMLPQVVEAIDRYLRARRRHSNAALPNLWVGEQGPLTTSGLRQVLMRRCADAGIDTINPHRFRHTFAHNAKRRGMPDDALMAVAGWKSQQMLNRYGASAAAERARESHRKLFGEDRL